MTADELRTAVVVATLAGKILLSPHVCWVFFRCPACHTNKAVAGVRKNRIHPWVCQGCNTQAYAGPHTLYQAWLAMKHDNRNWDLVWQECLNQHDHTGISLATEADDDAT